MNSNIFLVGAIVMLANYYDKPMIYVAFTLIFGLLSASELYIEYLNKKRISNMYYDVENAIICAACKANDGVIVKGFRHLDETMRYKIKYLKREPKEFSRNQGFIDMFGNYLSRKEAWKIFNENGQFSACNDRGRNNQLFSENLY